MKRRGTMKICFLFGLLFAMGHSVHSQFNKSPTIILIVADDLSWKDLSLNRSKFYETPRIDSLAKKYPEKTRYEIH